MIQSILINAYDPGGFLRVAGIRDFISLDLARNENTAGSMSLVLPGSYQEFGFDVDWIFEIYRKSSAGGYVLDGETCWFLRKIEEADVEGEDCNQITLTFHDTVGLLNRRIVAWFSEENPVPGLNTKGYKTLPADDMIRTIFYENFNFGINDLGAPVSVSDPTESPPGDTIGTIFRLMPRLPFDPIFPDENTASAPVVSQAVAWLKCLAVFQTIANAATQEGTRVIFDIVYSPGFSGRVGGLQFRVWMNQRGITRNNIVVSRGFNSLSNSRFARDYSEEITWVHVGGPGQGPLRLVVGVVDPATSQRSPFYPIEGFLDLNDPSENQDSLEDHGRAELFAKRAKVTLSGDILQVPGAEFGIDYQYGDVIFARHGSYSFEARVTQYRISADANSFEIQVPLNSDRFFAL